MLRAEIFAAKFNHLEEQVKLMKEMEIKGNERKN